MLASLELPDLQLILAPLLLIVCWRCFKLPNIILIAACLLMVVFVYHANSYSVSSQGGFILARFHSDPEEFSAYRFQSEVNQQLNFLRSSYGHSYFSRFPRAIDSYQQAREVLAQDQRLRLLVWDVFDTASSKRWINLSFKDEEIVELRQFSQGALPQALEGLRIVKGVMAGGFSYEPVGESRRFLSLLIEGLAQLASDRPSALQHEQAVLAFKQALELEGFWTSYAHRALAGLYLGNLHLLAALDGTELETAELECALEAYTRGLGFIRTGDHAELEAALYNNLGIGLYIRGYLEGSTALAQQATKAWRTSFKTLAQPNRYSTLFVAARVAKSNIQFAKELRGGKGDGD